MVVPKWLSIILIVLALIGFFDSAYLSAEHYLGGTPPCFLGSGCEEVTTSRYSIMFGIPVALFGVFYYFILFFLGVYGLEHAKKRNWKLIFLVSSLGLIFSMYFVSLQLFVIKAICLYCMISAVTTTIIFIISLFIRKKFNLNQNEQ